MSKEEYKPPYDLRKVYRYNPNSSITDILSEDMYFGLKDTKDNIAQTTSKLYDNTIGVLANDKVKRYKFITVSATLLGGLTFAALFNHLGADAAHAKDYVAEKISRHSFFWETIAHSAFALVTFMGMSIPRYMKQGNSFGKSVKLSGIDLAVLTVAAAPVVVGYEHFREISVTKSIAEGIAPKWAVLEAQGKLFLPYYISVIVSRKLLSYFITDRLGITNGNHKEKMDLKGEESSKELITAKTGSENKDIANTIDDKVSVAS